MPITKSVTLPNGAVADYWYVANAPRTNASGDYLVYLQGYPSAACAPLMVAPITTRLFVLTASDCGVSSDTASITAAQGETGILAVVNASGSTDPLNGATEAS